MLIDPNTTIQYLAMWVADYASNSGKTLLLTTGSLCYIDYSIVLDRICSEACMKIKNLQHIKMHNSYMDLHYHANENNGLVIGHTTRTYGLYYRNYHKATDGFADIFPLFDIDDSEVLQMAYVINPKLNVSLPEDCDKLDFCNQAEISYGIITSESPPHTHNHWPYFTMQQKTWIAEIHSREKKTRHKLFRGPYPKLPSYLCRRPVP